MALNVPLAGPCFSTQLHPWPERCSNDMSNLGKQPQPFRQHGFVSRPCTDVQTGHSSKHGTTRLSNQKCQPRHYEGLRYERLERRINQVEPIQTGVNPEHQHTQLQQAKAQSPATWDPLPTHNQAIACMCVCSAACHAAAALASRMHAPTADGGASYVTVPGS